MTSSCEPAGILQVKPCGIFVKRIKPIHTAESPAIEHDSLFVYHSIGGEWNPDQKLRRDPFELFCNPFENRGFGIFRYNLSPIENTHLINIVQEFYARGIMFDMQFDLASDDRMYCTEFVYKAVKEAS